MRIAGLEAFDKRLAPECLKDLVSNGTMTQVKQRICSCAIGANIERRKLDTGNARRMNGRHTKIERHKTPLW